MQTSLRVSVQNRDQLARIAAEDFGGVPLDDALGKLLDEHWERRAVAAVEATYAQDPAGFDAYLRDADQADLRDGAPVADPWDGPVPGPSAGRAVRPPRRRT